MEIQQEVVNIALGDRSYDIIIGPGALADPSNYSGVPPAHSAVVVSNVTVAPLLFETLRRALLSRYKHIHLVELPDGESFKDWATLNLVFDALLSNGCDRRTVIFALGGGVVGDMAGFAAACYMRGVPYVQIPTTLLAQVDSSVGGKTAVNHPLGKNMIGAFHQPVKVIADTQVLSTLPQRQLVAGLAEVIKYGPIADAEFLAWLEVNLDDLLSRKPGALVTAIRRCCEIKARVVGADERESGLRAILNFGHTFGHAIEAGLGYGEWLHGEAVGCGMVMGTELSRRLGLIDDEWAARIALLIRRAGLPVRGPRLGTGRYLELMRLDKKSEAGRINFVVLEGRGSALVKSVDDDVVAGALEGLVD